MLVNLKMDQMTDVCTSFIRNPKKNILYVYLSTVKLNVHNVMFLD